MRILLAALVVTACSPAAETPVTDASPAAETAIPVAPQAASDTCKDIAALAAAMGEPEPFASLRTGKARLGDREMDDMFTTAAAPASAKCDLAKMGRFDGGGGDVYVANCLVFVAGTLEPEKAKAAFDAARSDLDRCLPKDWSSRDGSQPDPNATEVMIYESAADAKRSMDASSYLYPAELRKEWSDGGPANPPGWRVTLTFQKEAAASPAQPE